VFNGFVDDFLGNGYTGVAATAKPLHLSDCRRTLVESVTVLGAHVAPAAGVGLGLARELHGFFQDLNQSLPAVHVFLFAEYLRKEEHRIAVPVGIAVVALGVANQAIGPAPARRRRIAGQVIDRQTDLGGVFALGRGRAFGQ